jgi:hypothetical protein
MFVYTLALFEAIENEDYEQCQHLLDGHELPPDLSSTNDDWTPLDLAVMINERISLLLIDRGARDSTKYFKDPSLRSKHLTGLLHKSKTERQHIDDIIKHNGGGNLKEVEKQVLYWNNRIRNLKKMKQTVDKATAPSPPRDVQVVIASGNSLTVRFFEPDSNNGAVITRYKVQWSKREQFAPEVGEFVICDVRNKEYTIPNLENGERYYIRVSAFNLKGFGPPRTSIPIYAVPSNWRDIKGIQPKYSGSTTQMFQIAAKMNALSQEFASNSSNTPMNSRRSLKKGITKFFGQGIKFHKVLKTGIYLSSILYSDEGRVLVTMDDNLPIIEVSDSHQSSLGNDFSWLSRVAITWENVQNMCDVSDNHTSSPAIQFRNKLLHAMLMLQEGTGHNDLGVVYHSSYKDSHGSVIFVFVQYIDDYKSFQGTHTKWSSIAKLKRKLAQNERESTSVDQLLRDLPSIIHYHTQCLHILPRGLYLGYLKARVSSSVSSMTIVTTSTLPNMLPYYKIRNNPNLSRVEWGWLNSLKETNTENQYNSEDQTSQSIQKCLLPSVEHFLEILGIPEEMKQTQIYTEEVVELNENVTFILLMPSSENVCTPPGSTDKFEGPYFSHIPISMFELLQLYTYQRPFIQKFTEVSAQLDLDILIAQKKRREAFSRAEGAAAKKENDELKAIHDVTLYNIT